MSEIPRLSPADRVEFLLDMQRNVTVLVGQLTEALAIDIAVDDKASAEQRRKALDMQMARLKEIEKRLAEAEKK